MYNYYKTNRVHLCVLRLQFNSFHRPQSCAALMQGTTLEHLKDIAKRRLVCYLNQIA